MPTSGFSIRHLRLRSHAAALEYLDHSGPHQAADYKARQPQANVVSRPRGRIVSLLFAAVPPPVVPLMEDVRQQSHRALQQGTPPTPLQTRPPTCCPPAQAQDGSNNQWATVSFLLHSIAAGTVFASHHASSSSNLRRISCVYSGAISR